MMRNSSLSVALRRGLQVAAFGAGLLALAACGDQPEAESPEALARAVTVVPVANRSLTGSLSAAGPLVPREAAAVTPEISGYRVAEVLVEAGAYVRRGQPLARLDGTLLQGQIAQQEAALAQAEVQAEQAERQAARVDGLQGQGVLSEEQIEQRQFQARSARAQARAQAAGLQDLRARQARLAVTAPVSGLVLERNVRPGDAAAAGGATPWFVIARDGLIELQAQVSDAELARIRPGQSVQVQLQSGEVVQGSVRLVSPQVDTQTQLGRVWIALPSRPSIRAGGFARANFAAVGEGVRTVPEAAVRYDADGASVMVVDANNQVRRVRVRTGARGDGLVELLEGPEVGVRVVASAGSFLLDGDFVRPREAGAAEPTPAAAAPVAKTGPAR
ncbi:efflux RND transporter periplasmic adaptor subunit [Phenylobacterium sp.]|uniref:efflux RND transporter periplasmic adaptor subunit n=1 Tax=Phenylobacterium sp. TaxID=1871053 RepID=UPI002FDA7497